MVRDLSSEEMIAFVKEARFAHLGCHANGETYVVPISFAYDGKRLIGQTKPGRKVDMMRANPQVCVQLDATRNIVDWTSVILWGRFEELSGMAAAQAMGVLIDHLSPFLEELGPLSRSLRDVTPHEPNGSPQVDIVYCVHVERMTGRRETPDA